VDDEIKHYFDFKSPFAYLAKEPAFALPGRFRVNVRWMPFMLRIKDKGARSIYSERKVRYSYMDARRWANKQGGLRIRGPLKVYDSRPALIGALFARTQELFRPYVDTVFSRFFERALEVDDPVAVAAVIAELGGDADEYLAYVADAGVKELERCLDEADADAVFGVPTFVFRGELFWGHDRLMLLEERLVEAGLAI
jgi:2-hydroxychromene-2-carboxylate isomerase